MAYHLFRDHPGDLRGLSSLAGQSQRVSASEILHIYRVDRPGQVRGVPWIAPVMLRLRDFDEYEDAQLIRQKIAACFSAFVRDLDSPTDLSRKQIEMAERLEPGIIEFLSPGQDIVFGNPPGIQGYAEYASQTLHAIAAGFGVTHEALTGDLSQVNFSSARMGWLEFHRNIEQWRWQTLIPQFCDPTWGWFLEASGLTGLMTDGVDVSWTPPRREMIDPTKETKAMIESVQAGFTTLSEVQRELGFVPSELLEEYKQDIDNVESLGLTLSSVLQKGQQPTGQSQPPEEEETEVS